MKNIGKSLSTALLFVASQSVLANMTATGLKGQYLGQTPPGMTPKAFAPGIISSPGWEHNGVFSADLNEFYYIKEVEINGELKQQFIVYKNRGDQWYSSVISPRVGQPFIAPDNQTMHLGKRYKIRSAKGWSESKSLDAPFSSYRIMWMTSSDAGTWAFDEATRKGDGKLRYSKLINGKRQTPVEFPETVNTGQWNAHPFIAPDESYLLWDGQRNSSTRNADIYVSFKQDDGTWGEAIKLDETINTPASENVARVTPDGKYLFFNRKVGEFEYTHPDGKVEMIGNTDVFWVDAQVIERHRPKG